MAPSNQPVPTRPDADEDPVTPEVEAELRLRLETFDEDGKAARPWQDVSREPEGPPTAAPVVRLTRPVRLSSLAARELQQARSYFDHR